MMKNILIVEDELLIAEDIKLSVEESGYHVLAIATKVSDALVVLRTQKVDLVLLDITMKGDASGIDLAKIINSQFKVPFVYLTSHSDPKTVAQAVKTAPSGYIVKPFSIPDLYTTISLAFEDQKTTVEEPLSFSSGFEKDYLFLKVDGVYLKMPFATIQYFRAAGNYLEVHLEHKMHLVRMSFIELSSQIPTQVFIQIHKSYIFNKHHITSFTSKSVFLNNEEFLIGRTYSKSVIASLVS